MAGQPPEHVLLDAGAGFALDPALVPDDADLVVVGNPTNPTSVLHPESTLRALARPGRIVVVDEAFMDSVPGEQHSLASARIPGVVVVRSLTKLWSIPGVRAGYVLAEPTVIAELRAQQSPWSVSTTAAAAMIACSGEEAVAEAAARATRLAQHRAVLVDGLAELGVEVVADPAGPFVLARVGDGVHARLRSAGYAVRRADTFPGSTAPGSASPCDDPTPPASCSRSCEPREEPHDARRVPRVGERMGVVTLVGGGPGDAGLVTVAGRDAIAAADVILTDRLVPQAALEWARPDAEIIDVSKVPGGRSTDQGEINRLLIEHAKAGNDVVRFKGGDSFVFGRGGEELVACADAGIEARVIPGSARPPPSPRSPASRSRTADSPRRSPSSPGMCRPDTRTPPSTGPPSPAPARPSSC